MPIFFVILIRKFKKVEFSLEGGGGVWIPPSWIKTASITTGHTARHTVDLVRIFTGNYAAIRIKKLIPYSTSEQDCLHVKHTRISHCKNYIYDRFILYNTLRKYKL